MSFQSRYSRWRPYVPVAARRRQAEKQMASLSKKGKVIQPVVIQGRNIANTFWGKSWCDHIEAFSDYENRLPRGRTYVRNGSVCHLAISTGKIEAQVAGSSLYRVRITIEKLANKKWAAIKARSSGRIASLIALLNGQLSDDVMQVVIDRQNGLFPLSGEMKFDCSCPDWAGMCKHVAAVLYGIGARLDKSPETLFKLRGVNHEELILADATSAVAAATSNRSSKRLKDKNLADVFDIDLVDEVKTEPPHNSDAQPAAEAGETSRSAKRRQSTKVVPKAVVAKKPAKAIVKSGSTPRRESAAQSRLELVKSLIANARAQRLATAKRAAKSAAARIKPTANRRPKSISPK